LEQKSGAVEIAPLFLFRLLQQTHFFKKNIAK